MRDGKLTLDRWDGRRVNSIKPVLLVLRHLPQNEILWMSYRKLLEERGLERQFIDDLMIIDIDDFEALLAKRVEGYKLAKLWRERDRSRYRCDEWSTFLAMRHQYGRRLPIVQAWLDEFHLAVKGTIVLD